MDFGSPNIEVPSNQGHTMYVRSVRTRNQEDYRFDLWKARRQKTKKEHKTSAQKFHLGKQTSFRGSRPRQDSKLDFDSSKSAFAVSF